MPLPTIGRNHALLRRVRALRRERALREGEGVFLAEGQHLAEEALLARADVERAFVSPCLVERPTGAALLERMLAAGWEVNEVAGSVLDGLQDARTPQPVLTLVRRRRDTLDETLARLVATGRAALLVVAHGLQDPGNLGALLRTADAAGADALVTCGDGADLHHPRSVRASAGSIFRLPAHAAAAPAIFDRLAASGIEPVAAVPNSAADYFATDVASGLAIFLGAEGTGLPPAILERIARRVHIPMRDGVNSLSVGAAAAVLLFDIARRRGGS